MSNLIKTQDEHDYTKKKSNDLEDIDEMNWDEISDSDYEIDTTNYQIKKETFDQKAPESLNNFEKSHHNKKYDEYKSNDLKRTNSASTKCTTSSFGYNNKYDYKKKKNQSELFSISLGIVKPEAKDELKMTDFEDKVFDTKTDKKKKKKKKKPQSNDINHYFSNGSLEKSYDKTRNYQSYDYNKVYRTKYNKSYNSSEYDKKYYKKNEPNQIENNKPPIVKGDLEEKIVVNEVKPIEVEKIIKPPSKPLSLKVNINSCKNIKQEPRTLSNSRSLVSPKHEISNSNKVEYLKTLTAKLNLNNDYTPKKKSVTNTPIKSNDKTEIKRDKFTFEEINKIEEESLEKQTTSSRCFIF